MVVIQDKKCLKFFLRKVILCLIQAKVAGILFSEYYVSVFHENITAIQSSMDTIFVFEEHFQLLTVYLPMYSTDIPISDVCYYWYRHYFRK